MGFRLLKNLSPGFRGFLFCCWFYFIEWGITNMPLFFIFYLVWF